MDIHESGFLHSRLHAVSTLLVELITSSCELLCYDIAQVHQVIETLLQSFECGGGV
jgi:hypothetical protein